MRKSKPLKLKGIKRTTMKLADGTPATYYYHRASMKRLDPLNLVTSFADAEKAMRSRTGGTFSGLIRNFDTSETFKALSEATKESYKNKLKIIDTKWGTVPVEATQDKEFRRDVLAWHEELGKTSHSSADNTVAAMSRVLSYAKDKSVVDTNVLDGFSRLYDADRSEMIWPDDLVGRFLEVASPSMATAMFLGRNIGQSQKDMRELPWSAYDGVNIRLRRSKTGTPIDMPCPLELKSYLDELPRRGPLILMTKTGRAYAKRQFNADWRETSDAAGAGELNFHDLRGTAATKLAHAGATIPMIASLMGWTEAHATRMISVYVAQSSGLAKAGIELLEAFRKRNTLRKTTGTKQDQ